MPGSPERSEWTVATLHEFLLDKINELEKRYDERYLTQKETTQAAMQAARDAVNKSEAAAEKRFDSVNELRKMATDNTATYYPRKEAETKIEAVSNKAEVADLALEARIAALEKTAGLTSGRSAGLNSGWGYLVAGIAVIGALVSILTVIAAVVAFIVRKP
jgi:hypothetical protein